MLIADSAEAIINGFEAAFGPNFVRVYCWFHVIKNVKDRIKTIASDEFQKEIIDDLSLSQLSMSPHEFECDYGQQNERMKRILRSLCTTFVKNMWIKGVAGMKVSLQIIKLQIMDSNQLII